MIDSGPLYALTATQVLELYKTNTITVEQYVQALLGRYQERNDVVRAWTYQGTSSYIDIILPSSCSAGLDADHVLRQARELDNVAQQERGPLHGIAVGLKDIMNTHGTFCPSVYQFGCSPMC